MKQSKKASASKRTRKTKKPSKKRTPSVARAKGRDHGLTPGQIITRSYRGKDLRLQVTAKGFLFDGTEYRSLTAAAKAATKYPSISGVVFWLPKRAAKVGA